MPVTRTLMTVDEFARLPQPAGGIRQELHHGELFESPPVKMFHTKSQKRLMDLLAAVVDTAEYVVTKELPFRPTAEYEVWVVDVALASRELWNQAPDDDYFRGVPAIVIEVLSPSNSASEMLDREETCLRNGGQEFWMVDTKRLSVKVVRADGYSKVHDTASVIQSGLLNGTIRVTEIFA